MSVAGNTLTRIDFSGSIGTHLQEGTVTKVIPLGASGLDEAIVLAVGKSMSERYPGAAVRLLSTADQGLYELQGKLFDDSEVARAGREYLQNTVLKPRDITHLILVTRYRARASVPYTNGKGGDGWMDGLGIYFDYLAGVKNVDTDERGKGVVVPFAYLKFTLVDVASFAVLGEANAKQAMTIGNYDRGTWDDWSWDKKLQTLKTLIGAGASEAIPELLAQPASATTSGNKP
jgi:hypothetical protein